METRQFSLRDVSERQRSVEAPRYRRRHPRVIRYMCVCPVEYHKKMYAFFPIFFEITILPRRRPSRNSSNTGSYWTSDRLEHTLMFSLSTGLSLPHYCDLRKLSKCTTRTILERMCGASVETVLRRRQDTVYRRILARLPTTPTRTHRS